MLLMLELKNGEIKEVHTKAKLAHVCGQRITVKLRKRLRKCWNAEESKLEEKLHAADADAAAKFMN